MKLLKTGIIECLLRLDEHDARDVRRAIARKVRWAEKHCGGLPDAAHDDVNLEGQAIAEICRDWLERRDG